MFKFDFGIEDDDALLSPPELSPPTVEVKLEPFAELSLSHLLELLPPLISYSPLSIPLSSCRKKTTLARRDLFDARFQLISEGRDDEPPSETQAPISALNFLNTPSDLVPGVYEGGLKTWECSLDLVDCLDGLEDSNISYFSGKRILEVGCGTGIPSVYILHRLFCGDSNASTHVHLQDYNASVLELITFPNIILAWYMSPSSAEYRASAAEECPPADLTIPGELPITPALKTAFTASLAKHGINLAFFSGSWESLTPHLDSKSDIVMTSETIYRSEALPALIALLRRACVDAQSLCLVAAKVLYFGVGGGVSEFIRALESKAMVERGCAGRAETVWERKPLSSIIILNPGARAGRNPLPEGLVSLMFKPGDKLNPYDPAALDLPGDAGVRSRLEAGTSPMTPKLAEMFNNPATQENAMSKIMQILRADAAERERTGETPQEQMMREKREWAEADAKSAALKIQGNEAFRSGDYKAAFAIYTACIHLSGHEPLYSLNRAAVALKLKLYEVAIEDASATIDKGDFNRAKAHFRRGQGNCFLGRWVNAEEDYQKAQVLQPADDNVIKQIAELKRLRAMSSNAQAAWISAQAPATVMDVFGAGELQRRVEEVLEPDVN